ncbi:hypothetical protein [Oceanicola sp. S124]|uniref:hypothetical protein n=1 Tax=Oceanicola sp. S124 TaxID=1042378 RepID=UPI0002558146|nr:hypothetical protein [Oceanicola sp. S124]
MSDPVTNVQIEDVLASIRRLVSEEVRAQTQGDPASAARQSPFRQGAAAPGQAATEPAREPAPKAEKLILSPHLRVATVDGAAEEPDEAPLRYSAEDFAPDVPEAVEDEAFVARDDEEIAPFTEVPEEEQAAFAESAEVFHGFGSQPAEVAEEAAERDFDEVLRALEFGAEGDPADDDFAAYGDGAAEALESARHSEATRDEVDEVEGDEAGFDDLDAVLSTLEFDPEPQGSYRARAARAEIEDAEILEEGETWTGLDRLFGKTGAEIDAAAALQDEDATSVGPQDQADLLETSSEDEDAAMISPLAEDAEVAPTAWDAETVATEAEQGVRVEADLSEDSLSDTGFADSDPADAEIEAAADPEALLDEGGAVDPFGAGLAAGDAPDLPEADGGLLAGLASEETQMDTALRGDEAQAPGEQAGKADDPAEGLSLDEQILRDMVSEIVRQELQGALGERITRNVRKLVRREIQRALQSQDYI